MTATNEPHSPVSTGARDEHQQLARALYAALTGGHDQLGYHVSGTYALWMRSASRRGWEPAPGVPVVERGEWRPCMELLPDGRVQPRRFNPFVLRQHIEGRYSVAPQAPSWVSWIAFDIDAHDFEAAFRAELSADDRDIIPLAAYQRARARRERVLGDLWRALSLGPSREPVIFETPRGGLHVYLPLSRGDISPHEHTWPAAWVIEWVADRLRRAGVQLAPGRLELFPSGQRLRAPCGPRMTLLRAARPERPDDLGLEPVPGTFAIQRKASPWSSRFDDDDCAELVRVRRPWAALAATLAQWELARRPLDTWLDEPRAAWSAVRGPFVRPELDDAEAEKKRSGIDAPSLRSQHRDEVQGRGSGGLQRAPKRARPAAVGQGGPLLSGSDPSPIKSFSSPSSEPHSAPASKGKQSPLLRYGREFRDYFQAVLQQGVTTPGGRHDAVLALVFGWHVAGKREHEVRAELEAWCRGHAHTSSLKGERFVKQCMREGMHYYERIRHLPQRARASIGSVARLRPLTVPDEAVLGKVDATVRDEARVILEYLHGHANADGDVLDPVRIGRAQLGAILADRRIVIDGRRHRADVIAVSELERLGVLSLYVDYSVGQHGRVFSCWYRFGSGQLAATQPLTASAPADPTNALAVTPATSTSVEPLVATEAPRGVLVLAERNVAEGTLRVLSDGERGAPWVELLPRADVVVDEQRGGTWWRAMYERRLFSVRDLRAADESRVIAGPWQSTPRLAAGNRATVPRAQTPADELAAVRAVAQASTAAPPRPAAGPDASAVAAVGTSALAVELGALGGCADLADVDPELATLAIGALKTFDRGGGG